MDDTVEIVERESDELIAIGDFTKTYGEPIKKIGNPYGTTLIYSNFAVDVVDGMVKRMAFFKRDVIQATAGSD